MRHSLIAALLALTPALVACGGEGDDDGGGGDGLPAALDLRASSVFDGNCFQGEFTLHVTGLPDAPTALVDGGAWDGYDGACEPAVKNGAVWTLRCTFSDVNGMPFSTLTSTIPDDLSNGELRDSCSDQGRWVLYISRP